MINVQKWTDVIAKEEAELENLNAAETQARADIEKCQKELEELHEKRAVAKDKLRIVQNESYFMRHQASNSYIREKIITLIIYKLYDSFTP